MMIDLEAVKRSISLVGVAQQAGVKLRKAGSEWKACCPFHSDRSPSFTIFDGGRRFQCFGCGASGDVLDFVQRAHSVGLREAAEMVGRGSVPALSIAPVEHTEVERDTVAEAVAIWRGAGPIKGTVAETYLRRRGLKLILPESLRFARLRYGHSGPTHPCLVALVAGADNMPTGIQRTYLEESGGKAKVSKPKLSLGRVSGGSIRLAPCAAMLTVCEGLEDGLSLQQELGRAVWVAAGASMMPNMRFPAGVRDVVIGADGDEAGEREARKAAAAFTERGIKSRIIRPLEGFKDFNAELQGLDR